MQKLEKYEVELLKIVKSCQPSGAVVIHDQCEGNLKDTKLDLGRLYNSGYLMIKHKQYSVTGKGELALAAANPTIENGETLPEREQEAKLEGSIEEQTPVNFRIEDVKAGIASMRNKLNKILPTAEEVADINLLTNVLDDFIDLVDPRVKPTLIKIKQIVTEYDALAKELKQAA